MFKENKEYLKKLGAITTTEEIKQQPLLWEQVFHNYKNKKKKIDDFLTKIKKEHDRVRVIFTGAGTSAYIGDTVLPYLKQVNNESVYEFQSVPSTDLVSNPYSYYKKETATILVSFARSGNSPESLASVMLGQEMVEQFYQITITCAADGKLAQASKGDSKNFLLLMPELSNDKGFAMTGSFTCMTLTTLLIFDQLSLEKKKSYVDQLRAMGESVIEREKTIQEYINLDFDRIVYLGSGSLLGLSREVQLKILELTAGKIATIYDSPLGFRHGPKSFVDDRTLIFVLVSNDPYTRQYDLDILKELKKENIAESVVSVSIKNETNFEGEAFEFDKINSSIPDAYTAIPYAMFGQTVALLTSVKIGNTPDTPSPSGTVNRVVEGVKIYDNLQKKAVK